MKSRITFNGMNRYSPPNSAQPGDCTAIVNLRNQSNCLKPVGTPEYLYTPEKKNHWLVYVHICYDGEHHITENENTLYYEALIKKENGNIQKESSQLFELNDLQVLSIQSIKNVANFIFIIGSIYFIVSTNYIVPKVYTIYFIKRENISFWVKSPTYLKFHFSLI